MGELKQIQDQNDKLQKELATDYENIDQNYRTQFIKVKTCEIAISDLEKFYSALDM